MAKIAGAVEQAADRILAHCSMAMQLLGKYASGENRRSGGFALIVFCAPFPGQRKHSVKAADQAALRR
ncbi:hypothetical protein [Sphingobium sp. HWE2-09]|uniref:hypothetical protein n=1 Tax=Sphingobium sp. HWE2-09 TaxID=3108390 RepID=UPI002DCFDAC9|nr:hypothetical protein [Sphingobium sp. HWE2-09]